MSVEQVSDRDVSNLNTRLPLSPVSRNYKPDSDSKNEYQNGRGNSDVFVFGRHGKTRIVPRNKGWLPYGITRILSHLTVNRPFFPSEKDSEILSIMSSDEVIIRLSRLHINMTNSSTINNEQVAKGLKAIEHHIERLHNISQMLSIK